MKISASIFDHSTGSAIAGYMASLELNDVNI